jgi:hypothetical protein
MKTVAEINTMGGNRSMPPRALSTAKSSGEAALRSEADGRAIRMLVFTTLYPNAMQTRHGVFVEERLRHLLESGRVSATVVAPVPWFPFRHRRFGM